MSNQLTQDNQLPTEETQVVRPLEPSRATLYSPDIEPVEDLQEDNYIDEQPQDLSYLDLPQEINNVNEPPQYSTPEFKQFNEQFKQYAGVDFKEAVNMVQELQAFKQQQTVNSQLNTLKQEWGVDDKEVTQRLELIRERFVKYPPQLQAQLDNPEGAKLIWAKLEQERQVSSVPQLDRGRRTTPGSNTKYLFSKSQIDKMSDSEYRQNANKIMYAYANGLVSNN
ncbi:MULTISPECIES: hypothetical protein [Calothrix]|uniref:Uncharacterized protein n=2 Tax=Calothrix TaxID=1186 RepID=A0ABR8ALM8_9CYAN|nr:MULTISPECIES: hypothetical protein [Calothrix]MBD2200155.1 hypothetical protein [Calothrix parietina FACHB-288]MBD2229135.1 hypothetical protein [Calothrix anomala FACHB-343]